MKKLLSIIFFLISSISFANSPNFEKAYFAGGCFWCMEESFENILGVSKVISGYSGGTTENPTYKEVTYGNTGHFEVIEVIYIPEVVSYEKLLEEFWVNIDPFDAVGQFCDKGYSYRSVAFYQNDKQKNLIENSIKEIEKKFKKKVVTYVRKFDKFYIAEDYHQDYKVNNPNNPYLLKVSVPRINDFKRKFPTILK